MAAPKDSGVPNAISFPFRAKSNDDYGIIIVPTWARHFFREGYKVPFELRTSRRTTRAWLTSAPNGTSIGADAGNYLCGGLQRVFAAHPNWGPGMWANFERRNDHVFLTITAEPKFPRQKAATALDNAGACSVGVRSGCA